MKKNPLNLKYIIFTLALIIGSFTIASSTSADTTVPFNCSGGGNIYATVDMTPRGPFPANASPAIIFTASGQIISTCSARMVSLEVQNNGGPVVILINDTFMNPGILPISPITEDFDVPSAPGTLYALHFALEVDDTPPPSNIGYVFAVGPHEHGSGQRVVYVPDPAAGTAGIFHPQLTVRVKIYGFHWPYYEHTTIPDPPNSLDAIFTIPAGTGSTTYPQVGTCTGGVCSVGLEHSNYNAVSSVTGANVGTYIPEPYHVCKYDDQPGIGKYFSPARVSFGVFSDEECGVHYPDAEVVR